MSERKHKETRTSTFKETGKKKKGSCSLVFCARLPPFLETSQSCNRNNNSLRTAFGLAFHSMLVLWWIEGQAETLMNYWSFSFGRLWRRSPSSWLHLMFFHSPAMSPRHFPVIKTWNLPSITLPSTVFKSIGMWKKISVDSNFQKPPTCLWNVIAPRTLCKQTLYTVLWKVQRCWCRTHRNMIQLMNRDIIGLLDFLSVPDKKLNDELRQHASFRRRWSRTYRISHHERNFIGFRLYAVRRNDHCLHQHSSLIIYCLDWFRKKIWNRLKWIFDWDVLCWETNAVSS